MPTCRPSSPPNLTPTKLCRTNACQGSAVHFDNNRLLRGSASIHPCTNREVFCGSARTPRAHLERVARPGFSAHDLLADKRCAHLRRCRVVKRSLARDRKRKENGYAASDEIGPLQSAEIQGEALAHAANDVKDHRREENAKTRNQKRIAVQQRKVVISDQMPSRPAKIAYEYLISVRFAFRRGSAGEASQLGQTRSRTWCKSPFFQFTGRRKSHSLIGLKTVSGDSPGTHL